jgi:dTDP-4-dehydrorhamnose reductase
MKSLLVTGARGFVAGSLLQQAEARWSVHALSRGEQPAIPAATGLRVHWHRLEGNERQSLTELFRSIHPDVVLHTAAMADIDYCEAHPEEARQANVEFTGRLAELCAAQGSKLVFCSSDAVFGGERAPYRETDGPDPLNFYALTKVQAEQLVADIAPQSVIARLALVIGLPVVPGGNSFLEKMLAALRAGHEFALPADEVRTPIDVLTSGRALLELAAGPYAGIFHLAGNESLSRFELGRRAATRFGLDPQLIRGAAAVTMEGRAPRARDVSLDNAKARAQLSTPMLGLDEALSLLGATSVKAVI